MSGLDRNASSDSDNCASNQERDPVGELPRRAESDSCSSDTSRTGARPVQTSMSSVGGAGMSVVPVPVERQTTLVLQGYFEENATREHTEDVRSFFDSLEGPGRTTDSEETFLQLGMEINRASIQLQVRYQHEFESMMEDLGDSVSQIIDGLGQIAMRLFSDPSQISWSRILTYFSFACWVIFKKGLQLLKELWNQILEKLNEFRIVRWITQMGGWNSNRDEIMQAAHSTDSTEEMFLRRPTDEPDVPPPPPPDSTNPVAPSTPPSLSMGYLAMGATGVAAAGVAIFAFIWSRTR